VADSLQDQLRALGLARDKPGRGEKKGRPAADDGRRKHPGRRPGKARSGAGEPSLDRAWALREQQDKDDADAARRRTLAEDRRRREINEAIRKIVAAHRVNRDDAEIARNFLFRGRIRKLYVTPEQQAALTAGELGIVYLTGGYHLLAPEPLQAARAIDADHIVELDSGDPGEEEFPVPDDISW
jgi:uncharacterized protein YaiL (DUF2058 family)